MDEQYDHSGEAFADAVEEGSIDAADPELFSCVDSAEGGGDASRAFHDSGASPC
jgi:predicted Rossmann-fold nucleotide-binding protein